MGYYFLSSALTPAFDYTLCPSFPLPPTITFGFLFYVTLGGGTFDVVGLGYLGSVGLSPTTGRLPTAVVGVVIIGYLPFNTFGLVTIFVAGSFLSVFGY